MPPNDLSSPSPRKRALIGLGFGSLFSLLGTLLTGAGHGVYFPLWIVTSPVGPAIGVVGGLVGGPIFWAALLWAANKTFGLVLESVHVLGIVYIAVASPQFLDFDTLNRAPGSYFILLGTLASGYVYAHALCFCWFLRRR
jgi:hypothetical protein